MQAVQKLQRFGWILDLKLLLELTHCLEYLAVLLLYTALYRAFLLLQWGWGGVLNTLSVQGTWLLEKASFQVNILELWVIWRIPSMLNI